jgi:hypothetical protein
MGRELKPEEETRSTFASINTVVDFILANSRALETLDMCGIAGFVGLDEASPELRGHPIHRMLEAIVHRGPDESRPARIGQAVFGTPGAGRQGDLLSAWRTPPIDT